jgi:signal peptidase I
LICAVFLFSAAKALRANDYPGRRWPWFAVMAVAVVVSLSLRPFMIPTGAMEDTMLSGDRLLVETVSHRLGCLPKREEIVTFQYPVDRRQVFVKRIAGVPGDRLRIRDKQLYRNGARVEEPYASHKTEYIDSYRDNFPSDSNAPLSAPGETMLRDNVQDGEVVVPIGKYFVMGDNRDSSLDSRYWGFITNEDIIGRPVLVYESFNPGPNQTASLFTMRWDRLFKRL